ncbi:hypothetical protein O4H61_01300 [Roseovarius aestuarii]|nr:hypothetical protein [Roseovarius aestuarii]
MLCLSALLLLSACATPEWLRPTAHRGDAKDVPSTTEGAETSAPKAPVTAAPVPEMARTVDDFDTTTAKDRAKAQQVAPGGKDLGLTIATLGAAGEPGFWLKTPLVSASGKGRVVYAQSGKEVQVDLIPIEGPKTAGSRMSLGALRLIDAPLAGLTEVRVFALD